MSICEYLEIIRQTPCVSCLYDPAFLLRNNYPIKHETYGQNINAYARKIYLKSEMIFGTVLESNECIILFVDNTECMHMKKQTLYL